MKASRLHVLALAFVLAPFSQLTAQDAERAERLFRQGDFAAAQRAYAEAADAKGSQRGALLLSAGVAALRAGALPEAVLWFERAARRLADPAPALRGVAFAQQSLGVASGSEPRVEAVGCGSADLAVAVMAQCIGFVGLLCARSRGAKVAAAVVALVGLGLGVRCALAQFAERPVAAVALRDAVLQREPGGAAIDGSSVKAGARLVVFERRDDSVRVGPQSGWMPAGSFGLADER